MALSWTVQPRLDQVARASVRSLSDIEDLELTPFTALLPHWTLFGALAASASLAPRKPAIVALDPAQPSTAARTLSYGELMWWITATANRIHEASRGAPPVVSVTTPLLPEALIAMWAASAAGIANPINPFLRADHIAAIMRAAQTTVLVTAGSSHDPDGWGNIEEIRARVPTLREIWQIGPVDSPRSLARQVSTMPGDRLLFEPVRDPDSVAALFHTGGTTSAPKLVRHTHRGELLNAWCFGLYGGSAADQVVLNGMPHFHVAGAIVLALKAMLYGQTMVIASPAGYRDPAVLSGYCDIVERHGISTTLTTPTTAAALVAGTPARALPEDFIYLVGGSAMPRQLAREFEEKFHVPLREGWGMTEVQGALFATPPGQPSRLGSAGLRYPYHRARCIAADATSADQLAPRGEVGILAVSGPCICPGYLDEAATAALFLPGSGDAGAWMTTGDLCQIDEDGYVWLRGRRKDLIIRGGHNIDPTVIEEALAAHPAVLHAAAVGAPDPSKGEIPVAYVQLRPGALAAETDLLAHCSEQLAERAAIPRYVRIIESMPLTAVGKIFKPALRQDVLRACAEGVLREVDLEAAVETAVRECSGELVLVLRIAETAPAADIEARLRAAFERYVFMVEFERWRANPQSERPG